ncbi:type II toxin-antitoxin system HipA family toxin [Geomonas subterranea]|uniref:type II toxin-antitoxin system HipA family toxin n=1 Tax=Geomonas subterranea TaxID=2847989 RepID=UPI001CD57C97|nr:type II toxin-antitoxin system HipA family toxin [Geomonas fuzhouensis]
MLARLKVYWEHRLVGELTLEEGRLAFRYDDEYRAVPGALPLSCRLPLGDERFDHKATEAFFANLLPEGAIRRQIARQLGISAENTFSILEAIGGDCAGAVSVLPPEDHPGERGRYRVISPEDLARELDTLPAHPFLAGEEGVRLSLAGAQNKLPIFIEEGTYHIPEGNLPSSHILKTAIEQLEDTVTNEAFCMNLARQVGLPAPEAKVVEIARKRVYLVERYDRHKGTDGGTARLHQEDFCQALGVPPELKYEKEGGPGFADCFALVGAWSVEPVLDSLNLLRWALFNFLIGNADAHAKNLSFLYLTGGVRLAPFYDLLSTAVYPRVNNKFAMKMGGQKDPRYLMADDLARFAKEAGVGLRAVKGELKELCEKLSTESKALAESYRATWNNPPIVQEILHVIEQRVRKGRTLSS